MYFSLLPLPSFPHCPFFVLRATCPFPFHCPTCLSLRWSLLNFHIHYDQPCSTGQALRQPREAGTEVSRSQAPYTHLMSHPGGTGKHSWRHYQDHSYPSEDILDGKWRWCHHLLQHWPHRLRRWKSAGKVSPPRHESFIRSLVISNPFKWNPKYSQIHRIVLLYSLPEKIQLKRLLFICYCLKYFLYIFAIYVNI